MRLDFDWSPAYQRLAADGVEFVHTGPPGTRAEHDVAHLMLAANGRLPWCPVGSREEVCYAEVHAVHLENLLVAGAGLPLRDALRAALPRVIPHMEWFVSVHYAPFPCSLAEALAWFWAELRPERIAPLFGVFHRVRASNQSDRVVEHFEMPWED
jgi:hypothetical protein